MGITLSEITKNEARVTFPFAGESVTIHYYPSLVTEKTFAQLSAFSTMNQDTIVSNFEALNDMLSKLIKSWDVFEDDEQTTMYPTTPDRLSDLPIVFRTEVIGAIMGNIRSDQITPQDQALS